MTSAKTVEQRAIVRLPCNISVSNGQSAPIGMLSDISLDGAFVTTSNPLPLGAVVPVSFSVGDKGKVIQPTVEVVRVTAEGMGLRFSSTTAQDVRRLRRYIAELANLVSNRQAAELLARTSVGGAKPFTDPAKIRELLQSNVGSVVFTLIAQKRSQRQRLKLSHVDSYSLQFGLTERVDLQDGEIVLGLYTQDYTSFSFESTVKKVTGKSLELSIPASLSYSERRTSQREHAQGATVRIALPWDASASKAWPVVEHTERGMSFLVEADQTYFWPGMQIPVMTLQTATSQDSFNNATVKHLSAYQGENGEAKVRVGVALPYAQAIDTTSEALAHEGKPQGMARRWGSDLQTKLSYLFHKAVQKVSPTSQDGLPLVVQFTNTRRQKVVGLLSLTTREQKKQRMPIVLVAPGFGARKETMSALALVIVETMRRQHKDVAVLRFDGTNSIGESYKEPGCESDGREHLRYSVSGGVSDILGAVQWAKSNPFVEATDVVIVSVSFSSIATRHAMTLPELARIRQWVCFMGAPDAQNAIMNIGGNVDAYAMHLAGIKLGTPSLLGCLVDADLVCSDMHALRVATLDDARREMTKVKADVTWFVGKNDAFMDAGRVRDIMSVQTSGKRQIIEVNAGHVPQSSTEAISEFALIARHIYRGLHGIDITPYTPPMGKVGVVHQWEWARIRKTNIGSQQDYWKNYLLGGNTGLGYDVWCLTPEYQQLLDDTAALAAVGGKDVLDLGCGTGNLTLKLLEQRPTSVTALDLVPDAVDSLRKKVEKRGEVKCLVASADGSCRVAMRRWLAGELADFASLVETLPPALQAHFVDIQQHYTPQIHAYLRGAEISYTAAAKSGNLNVAAARALMNLRILLANAQGRVSNDAARSKVEADFLPVLDESSGLPFEAGSFDIVVSSLVLSYMTRVEDVLFEAQRVLRPGGTFIASTLMPDVDTSKAFMNAIQRYESASESELPQEYTREQVLAAMREFIDRGAGLLRLQEEGQFRFWSPEDFGTLLTVAGFEGVSTTVSLGSPPQGAIAIGRKRQQAT